MKRTPTQIKGILKESIPVITQADAEGEIIVPFEWRASAEAMKNAADSIGISCETVPAGGQIDKSKEVHATWKKDVKR